ncbi:MAG: hypothetical protein ACK4MQ_03400 [Hyphomonas sp.]
MSVSWLQQSLNFQDIGQLFRVKRNCASIRCLCCQHSARVLLRGEYETMSEAELQSRLRCTKCKSVHGEVTVNRATISDIARESGIPTDPAGFLRFAEKRLDGLAETNAKDAAATAGEVWADLSEEEKARRQKLARDQMIASIRQDVRNYGIIAILGLFGVPLAV